MAAPVSKANELQGKLVIASDRRQPSAAESGGQYPLPPSMVDASVYTDPSKFQLEMDRVLLASWFPVCASTDVAGPRGAAIQVATD